MSIEKWATKKNLQASRNLKRTKLMGVKSMGQDVERAIAAIQGGTAPAKAAVKRVGQYKRAAARKAKKKQ